MEYMNESLEYLTQRMEENLSDAIGRSSAQKTINQVRNQCHQKWAEVFRDLIV